jgi:RNA polymerase sigma-70 factor (family 1)
MAQGSYHLHEERLLLSLLREGDRQAFDEIYRRHARELFTRAYQKTGVRETCEDILQDIFTGLWVRREQLAIKGSLGAYLLGMLDNKIIDHYRKACIHLRHVDRLTRQLDQPEHSPIEKITWKEQESALQSHVADLSEKMRDIFILSRFEQLSTEEISRRLSLSHQTVRNQISRALKILRGRLAK